MAVVVLPALVAEVLLVVVVAVAVLVGVKVVLTVAVLVVVALVGVVVYRIQLLLLVFRHTTRMKIRGSVVS